MVDDRQFDAFQVKDILRRPAAANEQVVAIRVRRNHARQRLDQLRHVAVHARALLDLLYFEPTHRERTLGAFRLRVGFHHRFGERKCAFAQLHVHKRGLVAQDLELFRALVLKSQELDGEMVEAGCHIFEHIVAHRVCDCRAFCAFHAHHRADQRFVVARIPHPPLHRAALCREGEEVCQQEYEKEEFKSHGGRICIGVLC